MSPYALTNWTQRRTSGPYATVDDALAVLDSIAAAGDEYGIIELPDASPGVGHEVRGGYYNPESPDR